MTRARPRPRRRKQTPKSRLRPCVYRPDATMPDPADLEHPLCACGLPWRHPRHTERPEVHDAQTEHRRRLGEREEDDPHAA